MHLRIAHLYPDLMNIYGDRGNILALKNRCLWRGIKVSLKNISLNDKFNPEKFDLFFGGGGQDRQQSLVGKDLQKKKASIKKAVEAGKVFLLICGTYQLFGHYFKAFEGEKISGIGILDLITIASKKRKIGNVVVKLKTENWKLETNTLVGFENHSGNTFIQKNTQGVKRHPPLGWMSDYTLGPTAPLGKIIKGFGNNGQDKTEGAVYKNVFGTYLHGSLLPKNPHFADLLIKLALENRYKKKIKLKPLDDTLEWKTHNFAKKLT